MARPVARPATWCPAPEMFASDNTGCLTQDMEGAKALLEEAGWTDSDGDGIREKDGMKLTILYQTSTNPVRQDFQALIKDWWTELGVEVELKNIDASVFFGGDAGSPDTFQKFYADVEMYANNFDGTDPEPYLAQYLCDKIPGPDNQWQGENINRFCDPAYDALVAELADDRRHGQARRDRQEAERHADQGQLRRRAAGRPWPPVGGVEHPGRRGAEHLGHRAVERRRTGSA